MKKYLFIFVFLISSHTNCLDIKDEDAVVDWIVKSNELFHLTIEMAFDGSVNFTVRSKGESALLLVERSYKDSKLETEIVNLQKSEFNEIEEVFKRAMKFNTLDDIKGVDGSTWCISRGDIGSKVSACFWTPGFKFNERGLEGLYELGIYLWGKSKNRDVGVLY